MTLRTIPLRRAGNRPSLFLGGDREMVMFSGLLAGILIFSTQNCVAAMLGIGLWLFTLWGLRLMAEADPKMRNIYLRHYFFYHAYYAARSTPFSANRRVKDK